ncbi:MAG: hypothetical protein PVJ73_09520 [Acidobacteriota bacterium]
MKPWAFAALLPQLNASVSSKLRLLYLHIGAEDGLITSHDLVKDLHYADVPRRLSARPGGQAS